MFTNLPGYFFVGAAGSGLPDGWLWKTMMAFALARSAPLLFDGDGCLLSGPGVGRPAVGG